MLYAYGSRAPSAKDIPDRSIYELALDTGWTPQQLREMSPRDFNRLLLIKDARELARAQVNQ